MQCFFLIRLELALNNTAVGPAFIHILFIVATIQLSQNIMPCHHDTLADEWMRPVFLVYLCFCIYSAYWPRR